MVLMNLGNLYDEIGRYAKAESFYLESLGIFRELVKENPGIKNDLSMVLMNLGVLYDSLGRYAKALSFYEEARDILLPLAGPERPDVMRLLEQIRHNEGIARQAAGTQLFVPAPEAIREVPQPALAVYDLFLKAEKLREEGRSSEASEIYEECILRREEFTEEDQDGLGECYLRRAQIRSKINNWSQPPSQEDFRRAWDIFTKIISQNPEDEQVAILALESAAAFLKEIYKSNSGKAVKKQLVEQKYSVPDFPSGNKRNAGRSSQPIPGRPSAKRAGRRALGVYFGQPDGQ